MGNGPKNESNKIIIYESTNKTKKKKHKRGKRLNYMRYQITKTYFKNKETLFIFILNSILVK